jgi:hypothetical protein
MRSPVVCAYPDAVIVLVHNVGDVVSDRSLLFLAMYLRGLVDEELIIAFRTSDLRASFHSF